MKKTIPILVSFLFFACWAAAQKPKNDWGEMNLKGKVKSIKDTLYEAVKISDKVQKNERKNNCVYTFNEKGYLTREYVSVNMYSMIQMHEFIFRYDSSGHKVEKHHSDMLQSFKYAWKYDKNGDVVEYNVNDERFPERSYTNAYTYKNEGKEIEEKHYNYEGKLTSTISVVCKYDGNGNLIERNSYDLIGKSTLKSVYIYDSNGNKIEETSYVNEGKSIYQQSIWKYDRKGNLIKENSGGMEKTWKYDRHGNILESKWHNYNNYCCRSSFYWPCAEERKPDGKITYEYTYDKNLNWIKRTEFNDYVPASTITERVIEYY